MRNVILFLMVVCLGGVAARPMWAQTDPVAFRFEVGQETYLHGDRVNVRSEADIKSSVVDNLPIGTAVKIVSAPEVTFSQGDITSYWYGVSYTKNGAQKLGFVWGGVIALSAKVEGDLLFSLGYNLATVDWAKAGQMRVIKGGKEISVSNFESSIMWLTTSPEITVAGGRGFDDVKHVIQISYQEAYCGGAQGSEYLFWTGSKLMHVHSTEEGSDAPVFATEELTFPDDAGGKANSLRVKRKAGEINDDGKEIINSQEDFWLKWNGVSLKRPNKK